MGVLIPRTSCIILFWSSLPPLESNWLTTDEVILGAGPLERVLNIGLAATALAGRLLAVKSLLIMLSSCGISAAAMGVEGGESSVTSSPISARVEDGVVVPGPPVSGSVAVSRDGGRPPPYDVGGEDDREVWGELDDPG